MTLLNIISIILSCGCIIISIIISIILLIVSSYCILELILSKSSIINYENYVVIRYILNFFTFLYLILAKIWALATKGKVVYLLDHSDLSIISVSWPIIDSDDLLSYAYFTNLIGPLLLKPNGTVKNLNGYSGHIYYWLPHNMYDRVTFILQNDAKSFTIFK